MNQISYRRFYRRRYLFVATNLNVDEENEIRWWMNASIERNDLNVNSAIHPGVA